MGGAFDEKRTALKRIHLIAGAVFFVAFLATGLVMRNQLRADAAIDHAVRFMRRADHVYLLLAALLNVAVGTYFTRPSQPSRLISAGSVCLLAAPVLFFVAFFVEDAAGRLVRPLTTLGTIAALMGVVFHLLPVMWGQKEGR
jgi:hypothetical protein